MKCDGSMHALKFSRIHPGRTSRSTLSICQLPTGIHALQPVDQSRDIQLMLQLTSSTFSRNLGIASHYTPHKLGAMWHRCHYGVLSRSGCYGSSNLACRSATSNSRNRGAKSSFACVARHLQAGQRSFASRVAIVSLRHETVEAA
jgi:hypothetical protein